MNATAQNLVQDLIKPEDILAQCKQLVSLDKDYSSHLLIQRFGSPEQPVYVDQSNVTINGVKYKNPLIMPIYDGQLELVQCAVMQDGQRVAVIPDGEFQRLKEHEAQQTSLEWQVKRELSKVNYRIHTDAVQMNLLNANLNFLNS